MTGAGKRKKGKKGDGGHYLDVVTSVPLVRRAGWSKQGAEYTFPKVDSAPAYLFISGLFR